MTALLPILLDASLRISAVAILVGVVIHLAHIGSSSLRHKAWLGVLAAMLLMPVLPRVTPRVELPVFAPPLNQSIAVPPPVASTVKSEGRGSASFLPQAPAPGPQPREAKPRFGWTAILLALYAAVTVFLLGRLFSGWLLARRLAALSLPISLHNRTVYECTSLSSPVTVGLRAPRIVLPADWPSWSELKLTAVLAHETAHVRRRDTLTSFFAHLNRCLFWFHPLAWWLQRQLSLDAEQVCDDAGVLAVGGNRPYAEVLLDIAETVRRRGRTLAFQGVGADGSGLLGPRIDRLLRGVAPARVNAAQKSLLAAACAIAIFAAAACHEKAAAELKPDPTVAEQVTQSIARNAVWQEFARMSPADAEALEAKVRQNPEDMETRQKLMSFYQSNGRRVLGDQKTTAGFWAQELWCIDHHPENSCSHLAPPLFDPAAYQRGEKLWESVLQRKDVTPQIQQAAAAYFTGPDPKRAEEIAASLSDPTLRKRWLAHAYISALTGPAAKSAYAQDVRKRLDASSDAALLASVGMELARMSMGVERTELRPLSQSYLDRATALDPNSVNQRDLAQLRQSQAFGQVYQDLRAAVGTDTSEEQYQKAAKLSAADRARFLPQLAEEAYWHGALLKDSDHDEPGARKAWDLARKYAKEAVTEAAAFPNDPAHDSRLFGADLVLAFLAVRVDGNNKEAREYLHAASTLKAADSTWFPTSLKLMTLLLRYGNADDRDAVVAFLELQGKLSPRPGIDMLGSAAKIRQGLMPTWYQFEVGQFK